MSVKQSSKCWELLKQTAIEKEDKDLLLLLTKIESVIKKYYK